MVDPKSLPANVTPLHTKIRDRIKTDGPLAVSEFMEIALGDPNHGYYRTRDPLGKAGDFITSPEISQVFGEIVGLWCAVTWQNTGAAENIATLQDQGVDPRPRQIGRADQAIMSRSDDDRVDERL